MISKLLSLYIEIYFYNKLIALSLIFMKNLKERGVCAMWKIQKYRINGGYSQERLAEAVDLSTSYISEIENGKKRPSMKTLEKIAAVLNVPLVALMDDGPDAEPKKDVFVRSFHFLYGFAFRACRGQRHHEGNFFCSDGAACRGKDKGAFLCARSKKTCRFDERQERRTSQA